MGLLFSYSPEDDEGWDLKLPKVVRRKVLDYSIEERIINAAYWLGRRGHVLTTINLNGHKIERLKQDLGPYYRDQFHGPFSSIKILRK